MIRFCFTKLNNFKFYKKCFISVITSVIRVNLHLNTQECIKNQFISYYQVTENVKKVKYSNKSLKDNTKFISKIDQYSKLKN